MADSGSCIASHASVEVASLVGVQEDRKGCVWVLFDVCVFGGGDFCPAAF